ncbi:thioredoxin TrxC [Desulfovibrio ferrophilus]|uniref:Thioredoxin n=1 Tax=Desulfovibrio ferrophilus TaxID=241368 RepID=A0A2Z6AWD7_9BACT|nr:thioredoxin TrxC [Desulfovibrio ferrophilus]BBD07530.1 thioredoxin [Desulfovibrio ferrophilus]
MNDTVHVTCPNCAGINRVQTAKMAASPVCGRCESPLLSGSVTDLNAQTFDRFITKNDLPVLVDFWSASCGPCQMMAPAYSQAATLLAPKIRLAKLQTDTNQAIASRYAIMSVPTMILFKGGQEAGKISGAMDAAAITSWAKLHA